MGLVPPWLPKAITSSLKEPCSIKGPLPALPSQSCFTALFMSWSPCDPGPAPAAFPHLSFPVRTLQEWFVTLSF